MQIKKYEESINLLFVGPASYVHRTDTGYRCGFCGKECRDQSNCRRHVKEKHFGQGKKFCTSCGKMFYKRHLQDHINRCMEQQGLQAEIARQLETLNAKN